MGSECFYDTVLLTGCVLSESGAAVAGARVVVLQSGGNSTVSMGNANGSSISGRSSADVKTDAIGRFSMSLALPNVNELRVSKEGFKEKRIIMEGGHNPGFVEIRLEYCDTGALGNVLDAFGNPAKQFMVIMQDTGSPARGSFVREITSNDGRLWITDVPA